MGLQKLRFDTNILNIFPKENQTVNALKDFQKYFAEDRQVVILLGDPDGGEVFVEDAQSLAQHLRKSLPEYKVSINLILKKTQKSLRDLWREFGAIQILKK